jgi:hypothetical protein
MPPKSAPIASPASSTLQRVGSLGAAAGIAAVDEHGQRLEAPVLLGRPQPDLLDVDRAEALLDRQPPRSVAFAGAQAHP